MNRPFYAFGVLLAALGGGMCAVGSTSSNPAAADGAASQSAYGGGPAVVYCDYLVVLAGNESERASYERGCGLDRCTGEVYRELALSPRPVNVVLAENEPTATGRTFYDAAYDEAVFPQDFAEAKPVTRSLADVAWFSAAERQLEDQLALFRSLAVGLSNAAGGYPHYDRRAAAEYAAAELAAADEGNVAITEVPARHRPRFSAMIVTLPHSSLAGRLEPVFIALQVRGGAFLEWCGLLDDCQLAVALFQPRNGLKSAYSSPSWEGYENLFRTISPGDSLATTAGSNGVMSRGGIRLLADALSFVSEVTDAGAQHLRRITRPSVAKLHSSDFNDPHSQR